jgi:hypothetical protein
MHASPGPSSIRAFGASATDFTDGQTTVRDSRAPSQRRIDFGPKLVLDGPNACPEHFLDGAETVAGFETLEVSATGRVCVGEYAEPRLLIVLAGAASGTLRGR